MWISKKRYKKLQGKCDKFRDLARKREDKLLDVRLRLASLKSDYEKSQKELFGVKADNIALEHEKNKLYELAYMRNMLGRTSYKELFKTEQKLANNLTQKVQELETEIRKLKGLNTYSLEYGEEITAESVELKDGYLHFYKDRECIKRVEDQGWELR